MAEMTLRLVINETTGKRDIIVSYQSDGDALPFEHEDSHQLLVERLLEGGIVKATELGNVIVERESSQGIGAPSKSIDNSVGDSIKQES